MAGVPITAQRDDRPADRRAEILSAGLHVFTRRGVAGAPIAEIRRRSGASIGSIYHHFGSKDGIAAALLLESLASYQDGALQVLDAAPTTRAGVEELVHHHIKWVVADPDRARFLLMTREPGVELAVAAALRAQNRRFFAAVQRWMTGRTELRRLPRDVLHALWLGPTQELTRHWLDGRTIQDPTSFAPVLARAAWRAVTEKES